MSEQRRPGRPRASGRVASGDVRQELLVAASRIFSERGIAATRISDVADAVGLRPSAVYYHFAGLDEIVATLLRYVVDESAAFATAMADAGAEAAGPASERLRRLITQHVARMTAGPFDLWFVASMPIGESRRHPDVLAAGRRWRRALNAVLADGAAAGDLRPIDPSTAHAVVSGLVWGALEAHHHDRQVDPEVIADAALRALGWG